MKKNKMITNTLIAKILDMTPQGVGKWKKENRPIINLLESYFTKEELYEFLEVGKIRKQELIKDETYNTMKSMKRKRVINKLAMKKIKDLYNFLDDKETNTKGEVK